MIRLLAQYLRPYAPLLAGVILLQLTQAVASLILPTLNASIIDDGIATGYSLKAAAKAVRRRAPAWLVVAAPVGPAGAAAMFAGIADEIVIVVSPSVLTSIGALYDDFAQVTDSEVVDALESVESPRDGRNRGRGW